MFVKLCECCRLRFWVDLAGWLPFDFIAMLFCPHCSLRTAQYLSLLRLLHLVRYFLSAKS